MGSGYTSPVHLHLPQVMSYASLYFEQRISNKVLPCGGFGKTLETVVHGRMSALFAGVGATLSVSYDSSERLSLALDALVIQR